MAQIQKTDRQEPMKGVLEHQAEHPWLTVALFVFLLPPAILLIVVVGKVLQHLFPEPHLWLIFVAIPFFILALLVGMLIGALLFVLVMKRFVDKTVLAPFYLIQECRSPQTYQHEFLVGRTAIPKRLPRRGGDGKHGVASQRQADIGLSQLCSEFMSHLR